MMNYSLMKAILGPHYAQIHDHSYISNELGIVYGDPRVFMLVIGQSQPPFVIDDYRLGIFVSGEIHVNINLVERHITPGTIVFLGPGSIISPISFSGKIEVYGVGLFADFPMPHIPAALTYGRDDSHSEESKQAWNFSRLPAAFNGQVRDFQIKADESDISTARHIIDTIWHVVHQPDYNRQTVSSLVAAMMYHYDGIYRQHVDLLKVSQSREQTIFDRFIYLVNQYATHEHQISFYADKMCLTERYLGTVIRQASGTTAKEWIDRALLEHIKIELMHTDKSVTLISEEMNFPNPSFFSKFFKRLAGQPPLEYRLSK